MSYTDIIDVENLCQHFLELSEKIFGVHFFTSNVHDLNHYALFLKRFGSAFNYSLFPFEDLNRKMLNLMKGYRNIQKQLSFGFFLNSAISRHADKSTSSELLKKLNGLFDHKNLVYINLKTSFVGYKKDIDAPSCLIEIGIVGHVSEVYKILFDKRFINSENYNSKYKKSLNNSTIKIVDVSETMIFRIRNIFIAGGRCFIQGKKAVIKDFLKIPSLAMTLNNYFKIDLENEETCLELLDQDVTVLFVNGDNVVCPPNCFEQY